MKIPVNEVKQSVREGLIKTITERVVAEALDSPEAKDVANSLIAILKEEAKQHIIALYKPVKNQAKARSKSRKVKRIIKAA